MNYNNNNNELNNYPWYLDIPHPQLYYSFASNQSDMVQKQSQQQQEKQRKKSRGNRKLQHYRRKLPQQGMDSDTTAEMNNSWVHTSLLKANEVTQQTTQTTESTVGENVMSPLKSIKENKSNTKQFINKKKKSLSSTYVSMEIVKPPPAMTNDSIDYTSIPDEVFSHMFSIAFNGIENMNNFSNEDQKIQLIRHYTSLIDRLSYVQLQEVQWKHYHHIGRTQNIWKGHMANHLVEKYSVCGTYGRSKTMIEQRLKQIEQHLQQVHHTIQQFEDDVLSKCAPYNECFVAIKKLSSIIHQFVQEKQRPLQHEFEYKREILIFDATDHQLIQKFFHLKPNKSQVRRHSVVHLTLFHTLLSI